MFDFIFKIWYMIAILPFLILIEGTEKLSKFLVKRNIYEGWDMWHSVALVLFILLIFLLINGYR